ncbi:MAG: hypothetical protein ACFFD2_16865 [Promethearchaeota archaeon]
MNSQGIELYNVQDEGNLTQMTISGPIKNMLNSEMVVLLVVEAKKVIYLWKGGNAKVRRKFIAARVSQDLRGQKGLMFKVESIDHGDEPPDFINIIGGEVSMEDVPATEYKELPTIPTTAPLASNSSPTPSSNLLTEPTITHVAPATQAPTKDQVQIQDDKVQIQDKIEEAVKAIIDKIKKIPPPSPYIREIVFIGPYAFNIVEIKRVTFGTEQIEQRWELTSPPEGEFLAKGYTPRAIIRSGKVLAVELLKGGSEEVSADTQIQIFKIKY